MCRVLRVRVTVRHTYAVAQDQNGNNLQGLVWPGSVYFPDFHNPKTQAYWQKEVRHCGFHWQCCTVDPQNKGHFGAGHFVPCREAVLFLEVTNALLLWERVPVECPLKWRLSLFRRVLYHRCHYIDFWFLYKSGRCGWTLDWHEWMCQLLWWLLLNTIQWSGAAKI